jgi:hypothetical protein
MRKEQRLNIRLSAESVDHLKSRAKEANAKNLSAFARQILERPPEPDRDLVKEIGRVLDLSVRTRQAIGSLTGNINQVSRFYNTTAIPDPSHIEWDRKNRTALLPEIKELNAINKKLIALCSAILGKTK